MRLSEGNPPLETAEEGACWDIGRKRLVRGTYKLGPADREGCD